MKIGGLVGGTSELSFLWDITLYGSKDLQCLGVFQIVSIGKSTPMRFLDGISSKGTFRTDSVMI